MFFEGRLLSVQRGGHSPQAGQWEFPGGKIEPGESAVACIRREIDEELGIAVHPVAYLNPVMHDYGYKQIRLHPFVCLLGEANLILTEHTGLHWVLPGEFGLLNWQAADLKLISLNQQSILQWFGKNDDDGGKQQGPTQD